MKTIFDPKQNRLDYGELLFPPNEYALDKALSTTYSLDLQTLVEATMSLGLGEATDSELAKNPITLLYALQKVTDKMLIFCDSSQIHAIQENKRNRFLGLIEKAIVPVSLPPKWGTKDYPSFHPKCWILQFRHVRHANRLKYRLIVMSRNLTVDRSWDVSVSLDGYETNEPTVDAQTQRMIGFVDFLKNQIDKKDPLIDSKYKFINELIDGLAKAKFKTDRGDFADFEFLPIGTGTLDINKDALFADHNISSITVMSPFVSKSVINKLLCRKNGYNAQKLITRESELHKIKDLPRYFSVFCLKDQIIDGEEITSEAGNDSNNNEDIHAKMYLTQKTNGTKYLYLGSMNASENGANRNVELLVKLSSANYDTFDFAEELGLWESSGLFQEKDFSDFKPVETEDVEDEFNKKIKWLCHLNMSAVVVENINGNFDVEISVPDYQTDGFKMLISPFFAKGIVMDIEPFFVIKNLTSNQLSEFYTISATLPDGSVVERIIKIPTANMPDDREKNIITSIISSKKKLSEYIAFILGDDALTAFVEDIVDVLEGDFDEKSASKRPDSSDEMMPIYERMLKTAVTNPDRIKEIESVIQMIDDESIVTPEFKKMYETFKNTLKL